MPGRASRFSSNNSGAFTSPARSPSLIIKFLSIFRILSLFSFIGRRLLDAALLRALDSGRVLEVAESPVIGAMLTLLMTDGMATNARVGT